LSKYEIHAHVAPPLLCRRVQISTFANTCRVFIEFGKLTYRFQRMSRRDRLQPVEATKGIKIALLMAKLHIRIKDLEAQIATSAKKERR